MLGSRAGAALRRHQSVEALRDLGSGLKGLLWLDILKGMVASGDEGHIQDGEVGLHEAVHDPGGGGAAGGRALPNMHGGRLEVSQWTPTDGGNSQTCREGRSYK